jgi:hypothetical protein
MRRAVSEQLPAARSPSFAVVIALFTLAAGYALHTSLLGQHDRSGPSS